MSPRPVSPKEEEEVTFELRRLNAPYMTVAITFGVGHGGKVELSKFHIINIHRQKGYGRGIMVLSLTIVHFMVASPLWISSYTSEGLGFYLGLGFIKDSVCGDLRFGYSTPPSRLPSS